jgi:hypothetical protein
VLGAKPTSLRCLVAVNNLARPIVDTLLDRLSAVFIKSLRSCVMGVAQAFSLDEMLTLINGAKL